MLHKIKTGLQIAFFVMVALFALAACANHFAPATPVQVPEQKASVTFPGGTTGTYRAQYLQTGQKEAAFGLFVQDGCEPDAAASLYVGNPSWWYPTKGAQHQTMHYILCQMNLQDNAGVGVTTESFTSIGDLSFRVYGWNGREVDAGILNSISVEVTGNGFDRTPFTLYRGVGTKIGDEIFTFRGDITAREMEVTNINNGTSGTWTDYEPGPTWIVKIDL